MDDGSNSMRCLSSAVKEMAPLLLAASEVQAKCHELGMIYIYTHIYIYMDVSENSGFSPTNPWVLLLKMTVLGCFGGTPIFGNTHII